jgi:hypothetical protein
MTVQTTPGSAPTLAVNSTTTIGTTPLKNRCGAIIPAPTYETFTVSQVTYNGAYDNEVGCSAAGDTNVPMAFVDPTTGNLYSRGSTANAQINGTINGDMLVAAAGYYFVNEMAYGPYEPGCHNDQVYGWYVNLSTGELQLFTEMDGVPTNATRACIYNNATPSSVQNKQLKVLNKLYKLSKSAVKEVNGIPSQEGNIVEVCDCKGQKWLLYINTASLQNGSPLSSCNYQFAIVATKLC